MTTKPEDNANSHKARAASLWIKLDKNQKAGIRFGMFPLKEMAIIESEGFDSHAICLALMDCAKADGGMRA